MTPTIRLTFPSRSPGHAADIAKDGFSIIPLTVADCDFLCSMLDAMGENELLRATPAPEPVQEILPFHSVDELTEQLGDSIAKFLKKTEGKSWDDVFGISETK